MAEFENLTPEDLAEAPLDAELDEAQAADAGAELAAMLEARSGTYLLLSRLFHKEVDQQLLADMHDSLYPADTGDADIDKGYLYISTFLSNLWSESVRELKVDFARCFLGQGVDGYSAAYPYESVYTSPKRLMMEEARREVMHTYHVWSVDKDPNWREGEDHISLELLFESIMGNRAAAALAEGNGEEARKILQGAADFLDEHLMGWYPMLAADMQRFAKTKFYLGLSHLTLGFIATDLQFLQDLLAEPLPGEEEPLLLVRLPPREGQAARLGRTSARRGAEPLAPPATYP